MRQSRKASQEVSSWCCARQPELFLRSTSPSRSFPLCGCIDSLKRSCSTAYNQCDDPDIDFFCRCVGLHHNFKLKLIRSGSLGNAFLFNGSRTLHGLALDGFAPSFIRQTNRNGVPWVAVTITLIIGCLSFLQVNENTSKVLDW